MSGLLERVAVAVIGGGQAGLAAAWHLRDRRIDHVVLERATVAHDWLDRRWDSLALVTPNSQCRLPGFPYDGDEPDGFMARDQVRAWLARYRAAFDPPVLEGVDVLGLRRDADGGFALRTSAGPLRADSVVIATGAHQLPVIPVFSPRLPPQVVQMHSADYRRPVALPSGAVLVVGSGQSGAEIAADLLRAGRTVHLAVGRTPRCVRSYRGRDCSAWLEEMGVHDLTAAQLAADGAGPAGPLPEGTGRGGSRDLDLRALAARGVRLTGRITDAADGVLAIAPTLARDLDHADAVMESIKDAVDDHIVRAGAEAPAERRYEPVWSPAEEPSAVDLAAEGITAVVWATGYRPDHRWVEIGVFDGGGRPVQVAGETDVPGLYFLGLPWMTSWGSGRFAGVARDAAHVVGRVAARAQARADAAAA